MIYQIVFSALGGFGFAIALAAIIHNIWRALGRGLTMGPQRGPGRPGPPAVGRSRRRPSTEGEAVSG